VVTRCQLGGAVQICEGIVIPNVRFREEDEEAFEGNYVEYLRKDLEGSDTDTRRRAACDFVRTLADRFPAEATEILTSYINVLLAQYAGAPEKDWPNKDCALHMVMALAVKGKTAAAGATSLNELVDIDKFADDHVLPELRSADANERPVLKADSLRCA
jgi:exportin-2 (importin alpha re-exporter)